MKIESESTDTEKYTQRDKENILKEASKVSEKEESEKSIKRENRNDNTRKCCHTEDSKKEKGENKRKKKYPRNKRCSPCYYNL